MCCFLVLSARAIGRWLVNEDPANLTLWQIIIIAIWAPLIILFQFFWDRFRYKDKLDKLTETAERLEAGAAQPEPAARMQRKIYDEVRGVASRQEFQQQAIEELRDTQRDHGNKLSALDKAVGSQAAVIRMLTGKEPH